MLGQATETQRKYLEAVSQHGSERAAAVVLGVNKSTINRSLRGLKQRAECKNISAQYSRHLVIPDVQAKPGVPLDHLTWVGRYAAEKKPDTIICIGDFADMCALSSFDKGKKSFEGRRYKADIAAARHAMSLLMAPIIAESGYSPRLVLTLGNHEHRISRAVENDAMLDGILSIDDLQYERHGWEVIPFLKPILIDGVAYCHYFTSGVMGRPVSSARALNNKKHHSCVMGHVQKRDLDTQYDAFGKRLTSIFVGGCYQHDEDYLGPQGNAETWRGVWMLNEVHDGEFDEMPVSLDYLKRRYA